MGGELPPEGTFPPAFPSDASGEAAEVGGAGGGPEGGLGGADGESLVESLLGLPGVGDLSARSCSSWILCEEKYWLAWCWRMSSALVGPWGLDRSSGAW